MRTEDESHDDRNAGMRVLEQAITMIIMVMMKAPSIIGGN